jgi:undecaprenyl-diphosphatase
VANLDLEQRHPFPQDPVRSLSASDAREHGSWRANAERLDLAVHAAIAAATVVNLALKRVGRLRPDPVRGDVPLARRVRMPRSTSFPSGHSASAFAFATGVGQVLPRQAVPLHVLAALVAYSRVHTGVHYPADAIAGAVVGTALAQLATGVLHR